jgi:cation transport regulator ChaC
LYRRQIKTGRIDHISVTIGTRAQTHEFGSLSPQLVPLSVANRKLGQNQDYLAKTMIELPRGGTHQQTLEYRHIAGIAP